ncbi:GTP pyrophosphokinase [Paenibacillus sp. J2TS4]|nr:GTP pyrophosphokinase [Paenibacillus sp. J2TS4]
MDIQDLNQWKNFLLIYKFALDEVNTKLKILNEEFLFIHNYNPIEHLKSRLKSPKSIVKKLQRKELEISLESASRHIHDIAGIRIICSFSTDIYKIVDILSQQSDVHVLEVKDYIRYPKPNGYRSLHLIIEIPVFLANQTKQVKVEVQIRTIAMDFWASLEHKIFYKFQREIPQELTDQLRESASLVNLLDKQMLAINEEIQQYKINDPAEAEEEQQTLTLALSSKFLS